MTQQTSHHETADSYRGEIVRRGSYRAVICKDGIQYIIQRRTGGSGQYPWRGVGYCATKKALVRLWLASGQAVPHELTALPDRAREYSANPSATPERRAA